MSLMNSKRIGRLLKNKRITMNLTQRAIATRLGFDTCQFISNLERGIADIPPKKLKEFSEVYEIHPGELAIMISEVLKNKALVKSKHIFDSGIEEDQRDPFLELFEFHYNIASGEEKLLCRQVLNKILNMDSVPQVGRPKN